MTTLFPIHSVVKKNGHKSRKLEFKLYYSALIHSFSSLRKSMTNENGKTRSDSSNSLKHKSY
jgi:hypothetical protein